MFLTAQLNTQHQALSKQKTTCKQTISKANIAMYTGFVYYHGHKIADEVMLYNYTHRVRRHRDMYKNGINTGNKQFTVHNDKQFGFNIVNFQFFVWEYTSTACIWLVYISAS